MALALASQSPYSQSCRGAGLRCLADSGRGTLHDSSEQLCFQVPWVCTGWGSFPRQQEERKGMEVAGGLFQKLAEAVLSLQKRSGDGE